MSDAVTKNALRPVITKKGLEAALAASTLGKSAKIVRVGLTETPGTASDGMTTLPGERLRLPVADGTNVGPHQVNITALLNESHPTLSLCGLGFYLEDGTLFAVYLVKSPFLNHPAGTNTILSLDVLMNNIPGESIQVLPTDLDIDLAKYVRITRTVNGKPLNADIVLTHADVKAFPKAGGMVDGDTTISGQLQVRANERGFRVVESAGSIYLQGGKLDQNENEQKIVIGGWMGKPLSFLRLDMKANAHPYVRQGGVDYRIYHQGYKPTFTDVGALPSHGFGMGARQGGATAPDAQQYTEDKAADFNGLITSGEYSVTGAWLNHPGNTTAATSFVGMVKVQARKWGSGLAYKQTVSWVSSTNELIEAVRSGMGTYPNITWSVWKRFSSYEVNADYRVCIDRPGKAMYPYMVLAKKDINDTLTSGHYQIGQIEIRNAGHTDPNNPASAKLVSLLNAECAWDQSSNRANWTLRDPNNITKAIIQMTESQIALSSQGKALYWDGTDLRSAAGVYLHTGSIVGKATGYAQLLPAAADLNEYKTPGVYYQSSNANATAGTNYPKGVAGSLVVMQAAGIIQTYHCYNSSEIYTRAQYSSGAWTPWVRQYNEAFKPTHDDVGAAPGGFGIGPGNAVRAPEDDLNLIAGTGFFGVGSATKNAPTDPAISGSMVIHTHWSSSAAMQMFLRYDSDRVYCRRKYNNVWQAWFEVYSTSNKPTPAAIGAVNKNGDTMARLTIEAASSHLNLKETDNGDKQWRLEVQDGNARIVEADIASRLTLKAGGGADVSGDLTASGGFVSKASNSYRMAPGPVGTFWRQDSTNLYLMKTARGDASGNYDSSRPLAVNLETGKVTMAEGAYIQKELTMGAPIVMGNQFIKGANGANVLRDHGNGNVTLSASKGADDAVGDLYLGYEAPGYFTRLVSLRKRMDWMNLHTLINAEGLLNSDKQYGDRAEAFQALNDGGVRHTIVGGADTLNRGRTIVAAGECGKMIADNTATGDEVLHLGADSDGGIFLHTGLQNGWEGSTHKKVKITAGEIYAVDGGKRVYHQGYKPTPADIGAVKKSGDTMTGKLTGTQVEAELIHKSGYQQTKPYSSSYGVNSYARTYYREHDSGKPGEGWKGFQIDAFFPPEGSNPSRSEGIDIKLGANFVYHQGRKPSPEDVGALATNGGGRVIGRIEAYTNWLQAWPNGTPNDANNYANKAGFRIDANNNGMHFFGDGTLNARRMGIQVAHSGAGYTTSYGTLELNPFGGQVRVGATGVKGALQMASGASIKMYDGNGSHFHQYARGASLVWGVGGAAEVDAMTIDSAGNLATKGAIKAGGGRVEISSATNQILELHEPGKHAVMVYKPKGKAVVRFCNSNGAGGENNGYAEVDGDGVTTLQGRFRANYPAANRSWTGIRQNGFNLNEQPVGNGSFLGIVGAQAGYAGQWALEFGYGAYTATSADQCSHILNCTDGSGYHRKWEFRNDGFMAGPSGWYITQAGDLWSPRLGNTVVDWSMASFAMKAHNHEAAQGNWSMTQGRHSEVGTYMFAACHPAVGGPVNPGTLVAGGHLYPAAAAEWSQNRGWTLPGTWMCCGYVDPNTDDRWDDRATLWFRVS